MNIEQINIWELREIALSRIPRGMEDEILPTPSEARAECQRRVRKEGVA